MMRDASVLVAALRDPASVAALSPGAWTDLLAIARAEALAGTLAYRVAGQPMPEPVAAMLADHRAAADTGMRVALWEAEMCRRALDPLGIKTILLKGTAYAAAGMLAARGRQIGDLDILVPRDRIDQAEKALLAAGWEWVKEDAYDDAYYRQWMHELPPMIHKDRDRMIDVHHTVLPLTARITPDADAMIAGAIPLPSRLRANWIVPPAQSETAGGSFAFAGLGEGMSVHSTTHTDPPLTPPASGRGTYILSPEDRICHAAAHLFADGDLQGGLRNLWDIHCLIEEGDGESERESETDDFLARVEDRASQHGLAATVRRAARHASALYGCNIPPAWQSADSLDRRITPRLLARNGWGQETHKALRQAFYIRSHWLRMPPLMLTRHLWTKWRKG